MAQSSQSVGLGDPGDLSGMREKRLPKKVKEVHNKAPAPQQITVEQILREAQEVGLENESAPPEQQITDPEELRVYKMNKRKEFEDIIRRSRHSIGTWIKYAKWEASIKEYERARSIWERTLDIDYRNHSVWLRYATFEMKNKFIHRARNVWDRAVQLLPRVDQLWYKYALMEEQLKQYDNARKIFERWMQWHPPKKAWMSYVALEQRLAGKSKDRRTRVRKVFERYIKSHPELKSYLEYAKYELRHGQLPAARGLYQRAMEDLGEEELTAKFFVDFAEMEVKAKEYDRARVVYTYAIDHVPRHLAKGLFQRYMAFEKQHGSRESIDTVILNKKRFEYEEELKKSKHNYDVWYDYIKLEVQSSEPLRIRETFERAVGSIPPTPQKRYWKRYIYLWIRYAIYEETEAKDIDRARKVYQACLETIPHEYFTFGKVWLLFAEFEIRQMRLDVARKILGQAIGMTQDRPKRNIFNGYIQLEMHLGSFDRCRKLYDKFLETIPEECQAWINYAQLETRLDEPERSRFIYELGVEQESLNKPELLWKSYIDFEIGQQNFDNVRTLYGRLLDRSKHVKVWISFARFEASVEQPKRARKVFEDSDQYFKVDADHDTVKEERMLLLEAYEEFERQWGTPDTRNSVAKRQPKRVKKRKEVLGEDGSSQGWREYIDYIFPDEETGVSTAGLAILERARAWKKQKVSE